MRVISGTARGLKLESPQGLDTRPTLDNVKEAVFSMLFDKVRGSRVLDLFAGSGALGIEALSRGCDSCVFSDINPKAVEVVRRNLEKSRLAGKANVIRADFSRCLETVSKANEKFDIIFLDPPYAEGLYDTVLSSIHNLGILSEGGVIVMEFDFGNNINIQNYSLLKSKKYGRACINILEAT